MQYHLAVACGVKNRAVAFEFPAYMGRVRQVAVVRQRDGASPAIYEDRLGVRQIPVMKATFSLVPTPSQLETRSGSS